MAYITDFPDAGNTSVASEGNRRISEESLSLLLLRRVVSFPDGVWRSEAERLMQEFLRTGGTNHLRAFVRHCRGIEARLGLTAPGTPWQGRSPLLLPLGQCALGPVCNPLGVKFSTV
jgi:hypothetical protein